jgi:hypothetical protein
MIFIEINFPGATVTNAFRSINIFRKAAKTYGFSRNE